MSQVYGIVIQCLSYTPFIIIINSWLYSRVVQCILVACFYLMVCTSYSPYPDVACLHYPLFTSNLSTLCLQVCFKKLS